MTTIPEGATAPQDHKVSKVDQFAAGLAELGLAEGVLPLGLRPRQRNQLMELALNLRDILPGEADDEGNVEVDTDEMSDDDMSKMLEVIANADELIAAQAKDADAYDEWSRLAGYEEFSTLITLYAGALGESTGSTN